MMHTFPELPESLTEEEIKGVLRCSRVYSEDQMRAYAAEVIKTLCSDENVIVNAKNLREAVKLLCSCADNLGDMPLPAGYAEKTSLKISELLHRASYFWMVHDDGSKPIAS